MRRLIVHVLAASLALAAAAYLVQGFQISPTWDTYLIGSVVYLLLSSVVGPLIKLLLLPFNLLTLGLFRWVASVLVLYIFDLLYSGVTITSYTFPGFSSSLLTLSPGPVSLFWALVLATLVMSITYSLVTSLLSSE